MTTLFKIQKSLIQTPIRCLQPVRFFTPASIKDQLYRQIRLEMKGHDSAVLKSYLQFTTTAAQELGLQIARIYEPPRVYTRMSLLKSVFVHKKHFHQYEMRTLYKVLELQHLTGSTAKTFLEYIERNVPEGIAIKVSKYELESMPAHIKPPTQGQLQSGGV
ncbi:small ribosomal subunit protein uS10m-like [Physella acuta]|uniref:small ribosomal subunit protein uS10m-like n=1 Tax=Physella acuta TaxID=109671 RepID=UPI0027DDC81E|nr:small ribosomal subunit protein uS10m-like [Physella acuta]